MGAEVQVKKFSPATLDARIAFAKYLATADMLPKQYRDKPGNVLLAMEFGDSLGIPTVQAISTINVIDGKPSASAALISALVRRAGHRLRVSGDNTQATATIVRSDDPDFIYESVWTLDRAVTSGLVTLRDGKPFARSSFGKPLPWETYTAALLKARAITEVARDACQEALMGVQYTPEELGAVVDGDGNPVAATAVREDKPQTPPPPVDDVVDAEIVHDSTDEIPLVLPDDFDILLQNAEDKLDFAELTDLGAMADASKNPLAIGAFRASWRRAKETEKATEQVPA